MVVPTKKFIIAKLAELLCCEIKIFLSLFLNKKPKKHRKDVKKMYPQN